MKMCINSSDWKRRITNATGNNKGESMPIMRVTKVTRGYSKKISFSGPGGVLISADSPIFITVEVEHDPAAEDAKEVMEKVGHKLYRIAREIALSDLETEYGEAVREDAKVPGRGRKEGLDA
jgi:hypothetical protein